MKQRIAKGFTLVEILIVVVILGILAAIVVPQFTNASQDAIKGALASQLQTINSQVELYRVQNAGNLPHIDTAFPMLIPTPGSPGGWGVLVEDDYLKDEPNNGYTRTSNVAEGVTAVTAATASGAIGWAYDSASGEVLANGFNLDLGLLANQVDDDGTVYVDPSF